MVSLLKQQDINKLALDYFGIKKDGKIVGYQCPYSGEIITNVKDIILEHIIPLASNGGTILFNCIPTSSNVNKMDEKGSKHLLTWWKNSDKYKESFSKERLSKILDYIFEAYEIVFSDYYINKKGLEESYINNDAVESDKNIIISSATGQITNNVSISYFGFIDDCIAELEKEKMDVTKYREKLNFLKEMDIFKILDDYLVFQKILKKVIKEKINSNDNKELTYVLNIDIIKLMHSILNNLTNKEIELEILKRINYIEKILIDNGFDILSFFQNIKRNYNILLKDVNDVTDVDIEELLKNMKLCVTTKFNLIIKTLNNKLTLDNDELRGFLSQIKVPVLKKNSKPAFSIVLNNKQLRMLENSSSPIIKDTYMEIISKSVKYNIYDKNTLVSTKKYQDIFDR